MDPLVSKCLTFKKELTRHSEAVVRGKARGKGNPVIGHQLAHEHGGGRGIDWGAVNIEDFGTMGNWAKVN
jgi:hypothetical protein